MSDATPPPNDPPAPDPEALLEAGLSQAGETRRQPPASPEDLAGQFPAFEILEILGQGGMGVVYKARQRKLDRLVAIKVLPRELSEDPAFAERFAREGRTLARLQHPHIVGVHDIGEADGQYYLVMEYVDGVDLRALMNSGDLTAKEALSIVPQICNALQYAHDEGIVHRDIKPENVMLDRSGSVKVADFGLAKLVERAPGDFTLTGTDQVMGTLHYMAPEQYKTPKDVDHRADIFSLGVVFYEMLTGDLPVGRFDKPSEATDLDARIDAIVMRTLERERGQRYQKARELSTAVSTFAAGKPAAESPEVEDDRPPLLEATKDPAGRRWSRWAVAAFLALPVTAILGLLAYLVVDSVGDPDHGRLYRGRAALITTLSGAGITLSLSIAALVMTSVYRTRVRGRGLAIAALALSIAGITGSLSGLREELRDIYWRTRVDDNGRAAELWRGAAGQPMLVNPDTVLPGGRGKRGRDVTVTGVPDDDERVRVREQIEETWKTFVALVSVRDLSLSDVFDNKLYANDEYNLLHGLSAEDFEKKRAANELGVALVGKHSLSTPLRRFHLTRIAVGPWERTASVTVATDDGRRSLIFPVRRREGGWAYAVGPVQIR